MCRRVTVATDNRHARLGVTIFGTDNVYDALADIADVKQLNAEFGAVVTQSFDLFATDWICDRQTAIACWYVVVWCCQCSLWASNGTVVNSQPLKRLRTGDLMDQMQVNVHNSRASFGRMDDVLGPDLVEHRLRLIGSG